MISTYHSNTISGTNALIHINLVSVPYSIRHIGMNHVHAIMNAIYHTTTRVCLSLRTQAANTKNMLLGITNASLM